MKQNSSGVFQANENNVLYVYKVRYIKFALNVFHVSWLSSIMDNTPLPTKTNWGLRLCFFLPHMDVIQASWHQRSMHQVEFIPIPVSCNIWVFDLSILTIFPNKIKSLSTWKYSKIEGVEWLECKEKEKRKYHEEIKGPKWMQMNEFFFF